MKIRLPAELKAQIETAAKDGNRTLNAEIVARLQASFDMPPSDQVSTKVLMAFTRMSAAQTALQDLVVRGQEVSIRIIASGGVEKANPEDVALRERLYAEYAAAKADLEQYRKQLESINKFLPG